MKKNFLFILISLTSLIISAQKNSSRAVYLDSLGRETSEENHKYKRVVEDYFLDKDSYKVIEFYKSGAKKMVGTTLNKHILKKEGTFIYYYESGSKEAVITYTDGWKTGKEYKWYENGNSKFEKENIYDRKNKNLKTLLLRFWDKENQLTVIDGNGECDDTDEDFQQKGKIKDGLKQDVWYGKDLKNKVRFTETYDKGKLISGISTDKDSLKYSYSKVFEKPAPEGGFNNFYKNIALYYKTPFEALKNKVQGQIYVTFVVDEMGKITKPIILKDLGYGTGEEAVKALDLAGNWIPGKIRGIKRPAVFSIPITIKGK